MREGEEGGKGREGRREGGREGRREGGEEGGNHKSCRTKHYKNTESIHVERHI